MGLGVYDRWGSRKGLAEDLWQIMANYGNGLETKAKILDACKELFYTRGFAKTTFKDIGQMADVNQGLIVYYYKTKNILANTVFQDVMIEMMGQIEREFAGEDTLTRFFISDHLYFRLLYEDAHFRDFIEACCLNGVLAKDPVNLQEGYRRYYDEIIDFFDDEYIQDTTLREGLLVVFDGMKDVYSLHICRNYERLPMDVAATDYITIYCHLMNIPSEAYGAKMFQAELLANQVEVSVDRFRFLIRRIK